MQKSGTTVRVSEQTPYTPPPEIHGFPLWVKIAAVAVGLLFVVSAARIGPVVKDAVRLERGRRDLAHADFANAAKELEPVLAAYPDSVDFRLDLAEAYLGAKDYANAYATVARLEGRELEEDQETRANRVADALERAAKAQGADQ